MEINDTNKKLIAMGIIAIILASGVIVMATSNRTTNVNVPASEPKIEVIVPEPPAPEEYVNEQAKYIADKFNYYNMHSVCCTITITFDSGKNVSYGFPGSVIVTDSWSYKGDWVYYNGNPWINVLHITDISGWK